MCRSPFSPPSIGFPFPGAITVIPSKIPRGILTTSVETSCSKPLPPQNLHFLAVLSLPVPRQDGHGVVVIEKEPGPICSMCLTTPFPPHCWHWCGFPSSNPVPLQWEHGLSLYTETVFLTPSNASLREMLTAAVISDPFFFLFILPPKAPPPKGLPQKKKSSSNRCRSSKARTLTKRPSSTPTRASTRWASR